MNHCDFGTPMRGSCRFKSKTICCVAQRVNFTGMSDDLRLLRIPRRIRLLMLITRLGISVAVIIMRTKNELPRFRDALSFSALLLLLPAVYPAQPADRFLLSPLALQAGLLIEVEPQPGPQPPCGKEAIPPYPDVDEPAIVKSWSRSDLG